jgi:ABC-type phosphate/phosphonate transport system substrate-binding protein
LPLDQILDENIVNKFKKAFTEFEDRSIGFKQDSSKINGFVAAADDNYDIIREVVRDAS